MTAPETSEAEPVTPALPTVQQAIARVKDAIGAVGKDQRVTEGPAKYNYRGIDAILDAAHHALVAEGLVIVPEDAQPTYESRQTRNGSHSQWVWLRVRWAIVGPAGDRLTAVTIGEAADTSDKATNKAHTAAWKVLLTELFAIPYTDPDPDAHRPDAQPAPERTWTQDELAMAEHLQDSLENLPGDLFDRAVERMTARAREAGADVEVFSGVADLGPAWLPVWHKLLVKAWETAEGRSTAAGAPETPSGPSTPSEPENAPEAPAERADGGDEPGPAVPDALAGMTWEQIRALKQSELTAALDSGGWGVSGSVHTRQERLAKKLGVWTPETAAELEAERLAARSES